MCLAVPLRLLTIDGTEATAEAGGLTRKVRVDFIKDPQPGQYVLVHAGFAIERVEETQALADREAWEAVQHALER